jgi:PIN domain nuclease of toxin-antitoxin system
MYLLDTHILIWSLLDPAKLTEPHRDVLGNTEARKFISGISIWEISLKFQLGKLDLGSHTPEEFLVAAMDLGFQVLSPGPEMFASFYRLKLTLAHKDPFDRMLIWQALKGDMTLMSYDSKMSQYELRGLKLA